MMTEPFQRWNSQPRDRWSGGAQWVGASSDLGQQVTAGGETIPAQLQSFGHWF